MSTPRRLSRARLAGGCVVLLFGVVALVLAALVLISALDPEPGVDDRTLAGTVVFLGVVGVLVMMAGVVVLSRRSPSPDLEASPRVRLWVHGRFGYQDVLLLLFPIGGLALVVASLLVPAFVSSLPQQAGAYVVTACGYFEEGESSYKCAGVFEPAVGDALTLPPHLWVGDGALPTPGESRAATLLADGGVVVGAPEPSGSMLGLGLVLGGVGVPILIIYVRNVSRFLVLRRRHPGVDVVDRRGWRSAGGDVGDASRAGLRGQARTKMGVLGVLLGLLTIGLVATGGFMAWDRLAPGRTAASVTVDWCGDSGDLSGPGFRPLVTCAGTASDGSLVDFSPESRTHLPVGEVVNGEFVDGEFVDRSAGLGADPLLPLLAVLAGLWVLIALVFWTNLHEDRRLKRMGRPAEDVLAV